MMSLKIAVAFLVLSVLVQHSTADIDLVKEVEELEPGRLRESTKKCPDGLVGFFEHNHVRCPKADIVFYYKCCGPENLNCCLHVQDWIYSLIIMFIVIFFLCFLIAFVRCCLDI
ncbi:hypothetical protein M3Y98_00447500 [Aphelenchoides besseyi]|nr:hypothetical protein M3Y98_00447500 [Aphelenchoides besseyi]KAI6207355.1 hypothetical protein M3Y96_00000500 [Aphelenchoides besseyi]